jgi:hypothetical protein
VPVPVVVFAPVVRFTPPARIVPRDLLLIIGGFAAGAIGPSLCQSRSHLSDSGGVGADIDPAGACKPPMSDTLGPSECRRLSPFAHLEWSSRCTEEATFVLTESTAVAAVLPRRTLADSAVEHEHTDDADMGTRTDIPMP